jgi:hopene-associated glycosyltransferase HpnB
VLREPVFIFLAALPAAIWVGVLLLPWQPWRTREVLDASPNPVPTDLGDVTVLIPARNESKTIAQTLRGVFTQGPNLKVILVDDQSTDNTVEAARGGAAGTVNVVSGRPLPSGWSGKLWALEQGRPFIKTPFTLLLDADIELRPGILAEMRKTVAKDGLQFLSLMAALRMVSLWERLLLPAFVYFFKLLYPFELSNGGSVRIAAAAGGCVLLETRLIDEIGGFRTIRKELIDDCALAKRVRSAGARTWIGLTHSVHSLRSYDSLSSIWNMVARTAFAQLHHSTLLLFLCTGLMMIAFCLPVAGLLFPGRGSTFLSAVSLGAMILSYLPTLSYYGLSRAWSAALPLIGSLYLAMTWTSAFRTWIGKGAEWKERSYRPDKEQLG